MNEELRTTAVRDLIVTCLGDVQDCRDALSEMETYVGTTGDWPEGTHSLLNGGLEDVSTNIRQLRALLTE